MVEKDQIIKESVRFAGISSFKGAYDHAWKWLVVEEEYDLEEEKYSEKVKGDAKELEVVWAASKKLTDYFRSYLKIKWQILGMKDVEVEVDGKKKTMNKFVELRVDIKGVLEKDYSGRWENTALHKFFKDVYHKYIIPARIDEKEDKIIEDAKDLKNEIKAYLELTGIEAA